MKSVSEFPNYVLANGLKSKAALTAEGKTPEEIQTSLGETFKFEGDRLKYFNAALDVAEKATGDLRRVLVLSLAEGEKAPPKAVQVEEHYYLPEFHVDMKKVHQPQKADAKGGRGGKGGGRGGRDGDKKGGGAPRGPGAPGEARGASAGGPPTRPTPKA